MSLRSNILTVVILGGLIAGCSRNEAPVLMKVGDRAVSVEQFRARYVNFISSAGVKDTRSARRQILGLMADEILLADYDDNTAILNNPDYQSEIKNIHDEILLALYKDREIYAKMTVNDDELRRAFVRVNEQVSARHLFARTEQEANMLYQQLQSGMTFEQLAPSVFSDSALASNGGYLGYFTWGDMDPDFEDVAFSLNPGEVSLPVRTRSGYSIIKVEDHFRSPIITEDEYQRKQKSVQRLLLTRKKRTAEKEFISGIVEKLNVQFEEDGLNALASMLGSNTVTLAGQPDNGNSEYQKPVIRYRDGGMNVAESFDALSALPEPSRKRIRNPQMLRAALTGLAVQQWLLADAESKGYTESDEFTATFEQWEKGKLLFYKNRAIETTAVLPDTMIENYYHRHQDEFKSELKLNVQEILVTDRARADEIRKRLDEGADFADQARQFSVRRGTVAADGSLGLQPVSRFGNLASVFSDARTGDLLGPLPVGDAFVIAKVKERVAPQQLQFDDVRPGIEEVLKQIHRKENYQIYVNKLREKVGVTIDDDMLMTLRIDNSQNKME
jgi:parvulin-like peptidyl-prolyl isomerase